MKVKVEEDYMTVDLLVWRVHGRQDDRLVERTLEMNPGLAALGVFLPINLIVEMPEREAPKPRLRNSIKLWD